MSTIPYDQPDQDWEDFDEDQPPGFRARHPRRFWGKATGALLAIALGAIGFYVGVRVEKSQLASSTATVSASSIASRFAAAAGSGTSSAGTASLRRGAASGAFGGVGGAGGGFFSRFGGAGGGSFGTVSSISGNTIYLTEAGGNMVKVTLSSATKVTKSVGVGKSAIQPGDALVVQGASGSNGTIAATSVSDSGARTSAASGTGSSSSSSSGSTLNSLFGSGGGG